MAQFEIPDNATFISVGFRYDQICGLSTSQAPLCWYPTRKSDTAPTETVKSITSGHGITCAIKADNTLVCWGESYGFAVATPAGNYKAVDIYSDYAEGYGCAVDNLNRIVCWGSGDDGQTRPPDLNLQQVSTGREHACAIDDSSNVVCWGRNYYGAADPPAGTFREVHASDGFSCAIATDATVKCWGDPWYGQSQLPEGNFTKISVAPLHGCGIRDDGTIACWGSPYGFPPLQEVPEGSFTDVSVGREHACGIKNDGSIVCWGRFAEQAEWSTETYKSVSLRPDPPGNACAIRTDDTVACWPGGYNLSGPPEPANALPSGIAPESKQHLSIDPFGPPNYDQVPLYWPVTQFEASP